MVSPILAEAFNERCDVFSPPHRCAGTKFDGLGVTPGAAALPPSTFADGDDGQHLIDAQ